MKRLLRDAGLYVANLVVLAMFLVAMYKYQR